MHHITGPINGKYVTAFVVTTGRASTAHAKVTATRPASVWDGTPAVEWVHVGPVETDYVALSMVIDKAATACGVPPGQPVATKPTLPTDPASRMRLLKAFMALRKLPPDKRRQLMNNALEDKGLPTKSLPADKGREPAA